MPVPPQTVSSAQVAADAVGVVEISVDGPLAEPLRDVQQLVEAVFAGETDLVMLEAGVLAGRPGEISMRNHIGDGCVGRQRDAGAFDDEVVGNAELDVPAVVQVVVVRGVDVRRKQRLIAVEQRLVVQGDLEPHLAGVELAAIGEFVDVVADFEEQRPQIPVGPEERPDFLEIRHGVRIEHVGEDSEERVGQLAEVELHPAVKLEIGAVGCCIMADIADEVAAVDAAVDVAAEVIDLHVEVDAAGVHALVLRLRRRKRIDARRLALGLQGELERSRLGRCVVGELGCVLCQRARYKKSHRCRERPHPETHECSFPA